MCYQLHCHRDIHAVLRKKSFLLIGQVLLNARLKVNHSGKHLLLTTHQCKRKNQKDNQNCDDNCLSFHCFFGRQEKRKSVRIIREQHNGFPNSSTMLYVQSSYCGEVEAISGDCQGQSRRRWTTREGRVGVSQFNHKENCRGTCYGRLGFDEGVLQETFLDASGGLKRFCRYNAYTRNFVWGEHNQRSNNSGQ